MGFFKSDIDMTYIERAILVEEIVLPELPPFPTLSEIEAGNVYYPRLTEIYEDTVGKFNIPILTPFSDTNSAEDTDVRAVAVKNIINDCNLEVSEYKESNYVELVIPRFILVNFLEKIPQGTKFIVGFVGGSLNIEDIKIIGVD